MAIKFAQVPESNEGCGFVSGTAPGFGDSHPVLTGQSHVNSVVYCFM